jgi:hypothetical protein
MQCHCNEIEALRVENDALREKALSTFDSLTQAMADKQVAEHKLERIKALVEREEARMAAGPLLFDGSHFPAVVTAGELREVLDA